MAKHSVKPPEWIDSAAIVVEESVDIAAPPEAVWARIADHESWTDWFTTLDKVEVTGVGTGVGGNRTVTVRKLPIEEEFTAWDLNERFAFAITKSSLPILEALAEDVRIVPTAGGSKVTYRQGIQGKRGFGWLNKVVFRQMPDQVANALGNLKKIVEG